ncbi:caspase family protein [Bradyrhizobium sp. LjRoot220]|uniref:caspase family protein n=1 Tax=Bradyrhizobium sp. LjRoot220 TaxID=3342284 RepID=UPI003ECD63C5
MRVLLSIGLTVGLICLAGQPALADKRVALVIGNSSYRNVAKLSNPANDAAAVAAMFKSAGFNTVESRLNLTVGELRKTLRDFGNKSRDADVAVIYFAGHGIELDGTNYLIPVDATLETDTDVLDEALSLDRVLVAVEPAKQLRLVILDACRDNPFAKNMKRTTASRAVGRGLARVEPSSPNTMIAFAAKAGSTASDGDSKNSPFAAALVNHLAKPGLDLRKAFGFVRDDVLKATNNAQEPFVYGSLGGNDVTLVPAAPVASAPVDQDATMRRDYEFADRVGTKPVWEAFIEKYPSGFFTALAKAQRDKLAAEAARVEATNKAKAAQEEQPRLAAEGTKQVEQAKAAAQAKAAEDARLAAEKAKQIQLEKEVAAEQARTVAEKLAAEKLAAEKLVAELPSGTALSPSELVTSLQFELRRVGCLATLPNGEWSVASQRSLTLFNKYAGTKFDVKLASADAFDAIKTKRGRVCPLICDHGFNADGDRCSKITCRAGYKVGDDNTCEKIEVKKPMAKRDEQKRDRAERAKAEPERGKPQASGQVLCDHQGCRPAKKGCTIVHGNAAIGGVSGSSREVCN